MIGKEVLDTLQALGLQEKEASARRLGEILQMLVDDPTISLRDWRLMFHKTTAYLNNSRDAAILLVMRPVTRRGEDAAVKSGFFIA